MKFVRNALYFVYLGCDFTSHVLLDIVRMFAIDLCSENKNALNHVFDNFG